MDNLIGKDAAFSISNILEEGLNYDRKPGDWYGPSTMIQILEKLNTKYKPFPDLEIISFPESIIYIETIKNRISSKYTPLIIFVGYRLGLKQINPKYFASIIRIMEFKNFMGINGAQGNSALYFIGHQCGKLIYLDPHVTQRAIPKIEDLWVEHMSYHCPSTLMLPIGKLNTSFSMGFYLRKKEDYEMFIQQIKEEAKKEDSFIQILDKEISMEIPSSKEEKVHPISEEEGGDGFIVC